MKGAGAFNLPKSCRKKKTKTFSEKEEQVKGLDNLLECFPPTRGPGQPI